MNPNERASQRFFSALAQHCPLASVTHLYLTHQEITSTLFLLGTLAEAGFSGALVAARASLAQAGMAVLPQGATVLSDHPSNREPADHILMELNQGREAARVAIEAALQAISATGRVWIFGSKEAGILSIGKRFSHSKTAFYKGHLRLISLTRESRYVEKPGKKTARTNLAYDPEGFLTFPCEGLTIASRPGLFSWQEPDPASLLLLSAMAQKGLDPGPLVLDWGCGTGLLSAVLAKRWPDTRFILSDDQINAVHCAQHTMDLNQLSHRCQIIAEDGIGTTLAQNRYTTILSNPPFHRGVRNDHSAVHSFIKQGVDLLEKGGSFWLVGNRFLDHTSALSQVLKQVETIKQTSQYTVIRGWK
ncbi:MAG: methyltransferase [Magnetococcales bacterium]|nr:methyltransferase [Magnetococcales bacterium]